MICFQISIFAESYTPVFLVISHTASLWFAFKLVSLQSHIHLLLADGTNLFVVICFQISIFAESYTPCTVVRNLDNPLWFAFKLVSLQSHIHLFIALGSISLVVICFQISIFAESYTPSAWSGCNPHLLWFAFKLVSLQSHIHPPSVRIAEVVRCDLLSN